LRTLAAACLLVWGTCAQALTVGPAVVSSSLGEPLQAEFPLTRLSDAQTRELQGRLADDRAYEVARLERAAALEGLDIRVETRPDGRRVLVLKGKQAVQTPFVDLLVELRWPGGRLLRDLTVLLQAQATDKPVSLPPSRLMVQAGDTAGKLARDHKDDQVSLEQMLLALLKQNPDAFVDGNVNRLRTGALLSLPSSAEAGRVEQDTAREALLEQAEAFDAWRAGLAQRVTAGDAPDSTDGNRLAVPSAPSARNGTPQDRLELTKPGSGQEDRIALQRQAQDTAERAAELARNIAELGKIAGGQTTGEEAATTGIPLPAPDVPAHGRLIDILREHPLTPIAAASLVALLVLMSLWRSRVRRKDSDGVSTPVASAASHTIPQEATATARAPFPVDLDLELPRFDKALPEDPATPTTTSPQSQPAPAPRPLAQDPFAGISLDLPQDLPPASGQFPFDAEPVDPALTVRFELAQTLWAAGQPHTARALAEEVVAQAHGPFQQAAHRWLASRT
jgi:pilus assembly protein FimV